MPHSKMRSSTSATRPTAATTMVINAGSGPWSPAPGAAPAFGACAEWAGVHAARTSGRTRPGRPPRRRPGRQRPEATWRFGRRASRTDPRSGHRMWGGQGAPRPSQTGWIPFAPVRGLSCLQPGEGDQPRTRPSSIIRAQRYDFGRSCEVRRQPRRRLGLSAKRRRRGNVRGYGGADEGTVARRPGDDAGAPVTPLERGSHTAETAVGAGADRAGESRDGRTSSPRAVRGRARFRKEVGGTVRRRSPRRPGAGPAASAVDQGGARQIRGDAPGSRRRPATRQAAPTPPEKTSRSADDGAGPSGRRVADDRARPRPVTRRGGRDARRHRLCRATRRRACPYRARVRRRSAGHGLRLHARPDALLGWYRPLTLDERAYIPPRYAALPTSASSPAAATRRTSRPCARPGPM